MSCKRGSPNVYERARLPLVYSEPLLDELLDELLTLLSYPPFKPISMITGVREKTPAPDGWPMGAAPAPADKPVEAPDKSDVPVAAFVVGPGEIVVGVDGMVAVDVSDDGAVSSRLSVTPDAILGQTLIASGSIVIIKTLRAFKSSCVMSYDRAKKSGIWVMNQQPSVSGQLNLINFF